MIIIEIPQGTEAYRELQEAARDDDAYLVRIALDEGTFKIKVNEGSWSPPLDGVNILSPGTRQEVTSDVLGY